jgi:chlorobactene glucosyltransferase
VIALHLALLFGLLGLFALLVDNLRRFERLPARSGGLAGRRVSVLVPARDEAETIGACLASLTAQEGEIEIRVLDDGSRDRTAEIVAEVAERDARVALLTGGALPGGWKGKNFACHQLSETSSGDWLLFVDADVRLAPGAIAAALDLAEARGADLLSVFPEQECGTLGEKLLIPLLSFVLLAFLPFRLLAWPDPRIAAANGQFMLFRRDAYRAIGGHRGVQGEIVEDIALARQIKRSGRRLALADGTGSVTCRMYRSLGEIWQGFSKNLYPAFGGRPAPFWFSMGIMGFFFLGPYGLVMIPEEGAPGGRALALTAIFMGLGMRGLLAWRLRQSALAVLGHPVAIGFLLALGLRSFWTARFGRTVPWKGRSYTS